MGWGRNKSEVREGGRSRAGAGPAGRFRVQDTSEVWSIVRVGTRGQSESRVGVRMGVRQASAG